MDCFLSAGKQYTLSLRDLHRDHAAVIEQRLPSKAQKPNAQRFKKSAERIIPAVLLHISKKAERVPVNKTARAADKAGIVPLDPDSAGIQPQGGKSVPQSRRVNPRIRRCDRVMCDNTGAFRLALLHMDGRKSGLFRCMQSRPRHILLIGKEKAAR